MAESLSYGVGSRSTSLVKIGGALAIAGTFVGTAIFVLGCFGFGAAFTLALIPTALGAIGLALALIGGLFQGTEGVEDPQVLASLLVSLAVLCGGLLEVAIWLNVPFFAISGK